MRQKELQDSLNHIIIGVLWYRNHTFTPFHCQTMLMQMIVYKFISNESPRHTPRAFVVYELNLNGFIVHGIGVHDPSSKNTVRIIAGAVEHQSVANEST